MSAKRLLIVQTGSAISSAKKIYGDFPQWFIQSMNLNPALVNICKVYQGEQLPPPASINAIIITGSASMVTDKDDWSIKTQYWLEKTLVFKIPVMGICYGHQLLVDLLGGYVDNNPLGRYLGSATVCLTSSAQDDPIFASKKTQNTVYVSHVQRALKLPDGALNLGYAEHDECHMFRYGSCVWGVQFHPEWTYDITRCYIEQRKASLLKEGLNPDVMIRALQPEAPEGKVWLQRFANMVFNRH